MPLLNVLTQNLSSELWITFSSVNQSLNFHLSAEDLSNRFANYFSDKITNIRTVILEKHKQDDYDYEPPSVNTPNLISFDTFCPVTVEEICKTIMCCPTTSCVLDPLPKQLLKINDDILSPVITRIVNLSLTTGKFSSSQKSAIITPLLKKASLDPESLKDYLPVSNLTFVSKLLERMVAKQLQLYEKHQSAYRKRHSTETASTRVQNDILRAMDDSKATVLVLLDLSAAFDTVDHNFLLERLKQFGISGTAQFWFKSYLEDRSQKVHLRGSSSASSSLRFGVLQGSVLGPILFTIYTIPLCEICRRHGVQYHLYADDTQLYVSFKVCDAVDLLEAQRRIEMCIAEIKAWMVMFMLKLNEDKTELVIIAPPYFLHHNKVPLSSVQVGDSGISTSKCARNIGVMFDHHMDMTTQVTKMCQAAWFQLRNIRSVRSSLTKEATLRLVCSLVMPRLDYGSISLYGTSEGLLDKLQKAQNAAARLVVKCLRSDHITPHLRDLHWLPVRSRIKYKILVTTYRALHNEAPAYISEMLTPYIPLRTLCCSQAMERTANIYKKLSLHFFFQTICQDLSF